MEGECQSRGSRGIRVEDGANAPAPDAAVKCFGQHFGSVRFSGPPNLPGGAGTIVSPGLAGHARDGNCVSVSGAGAADCFAIPGRCRHRPLLWISLRGIESLIGRQSRPFFPLCPAGRGQGEAFHTCNLERLHSRKEALIPLSGPSPILRTGEGGRRPDEGSFSAARSLLSCLS